MCMSVFFQSRTFLRDHFVLMLGICLSLYFSYHVMAGQRSLLRLMQVNAQIEVAAAALDDMRAERSGIEERVVMLRPGHLNRDYVEELVIRDLGYYQTSELALVPDQGR